MGAMEKLERGGVRPQPEQRLISLPIEILSWTNTSGEMPQTATSVIRSDKFPQFPLCRREASPEVLISTSSQAARKMLLTTQFRSYTILHLSERL